MRTTSVRGAGVLAGLAALMALLPARALAQPQGGDGMAGSYAPPAFQLPYPLYSTRPEAGGLYMAGSYVMYQQSNPLQSQPIAYRGFIATDDTVLNAAGSAGTFVGTRNDVLDTNMVTGPLSYQPGFRVEIGWRFAGGDALSIDFLYVTEAQYNAVATLVAPNLQFRSDQADTFLTSYVYNFPVDFAGAPSKIITPSGTAGPFSVYGIWNGASSMQLLFLQRFQQLQATYRKPVYETENYRASAVMGPRYFWLEEKFRWMTTDVDAFGNSAPQWVGIYNNQVDNRMYGIWAGIQQEWYLGRGFAAMLTLDGAAFLDIAKLKADYQRGDGFVENKRARTKWTAVPEVQVTPSLMWYPLEGIQMLIGWDFFAFFNTVASPHPVDFNYGSITPQYTDGNFRWFNGFQASFAIIF